MTHHVPHHHHPRRYVSRGWYYGPVGAGLIAAAMVLAVGGVWFAAVLLTVFAAVMIGAYLRDGQ